MVTAFVDILHPDPGPLAYRAIRLSASGGVEGIEHIAARDDAEAAALTSRMANGYGIDLWERGRFLDCFPSLNVNAPGALA
ncbi:hypothetical protein [Methylorubrum zatmanii]|uniref:Uncharacterized protein n=1 Tax=Methylorubrum zatmanii TaxID=29429 RepID=A0ABW1WMC7_9HYPH|nr:hypothetical protein [Methylorubrum zatmanii]MBD8909460.1 hypothetical protein [Methylorubrum zatmanii]